MTTEDALNPPKNPSAFTPKGVRGEVGRPNGKTDRAKARRAMTPEARRAARRQRRLAQKSPQKPAVAAPVAATPAKKKGKA